MRSFYLVSLTHISYLRSPIQLSLILNLLSLISYPPSPILLLLSFISYPSISYPCISYPPSPILHLLSSISYPPSPILVSPILHLLSLYLLSSISYLCISYPPISYRAISPRNIDCVHGSALDPPRKGEIGEIGGRLVHSDMGDMELGDPADMAR